MGISKWLGIDQLERENEILRQYNKQQNLVLQSIFQTTREYQKKNPCISHVGFEKIQRLTENGLDYAVQKEIELANIE